jgi:hypothetical protein
MSQTIGGVKSVFIKPFDPLLQKRGCRNRVAHLHHRPERPSRHGNNGISQNPEKTNGLGYARRKIPINF